MMLNLFLAVLQWLVLTPALWCSWMLARFITRDMPQHPWRSDEGEFVSFDNWCKHGTPLLQTLSICIFYGFAAALALIVRLIRDAS